VLICLASQARTEEDRLAILRGGTLRLENFVLVNYETQIRIRQVIAKFDQNMHFTLILTKPENLDK